MHSMPFRGEASTILVGVFRTERSFPRIVVTGSARLGYYRKGGDSLANRYRRFRLRPFSLREFDPRPSASHLEALLQFETFLSLSFARK